MHVNNSVWNPEALARLLDELAETLGYTRDDLARRAGVHRSQVSRWVNGKHRPTYGAIDKMTAAIRAEQPDEETGRLLSAIVAAAGYGRVAHKVETRRFDTPAGQIAQHIVEDLEADTGDMPEAEARALVERALEHARNQALLYLHMERERRGRLRERDGVE